MNKYICLPEVLSLLRSDEKEDLHVKIGKIHGDLAN